MQDLTAVLTEPVPAVSAEHVKRLWSFSAQHPSNSGISISVRAIAELCSPDSVDPIAIWARVSLIGLLLAQHRLGRWQTESGLHPSVFANAAMFPLQHGLQGFDPDEFLALLST